MTDHLALVAPSVTMVEKLLVALVLAVSSDALASPDDPSVDDDIAAYKTEVDPGKKAEYLTKIVDALTRAKDCTRAKVYLDEYVELAIAKTDGTPVAFTKKSM